MDLQVSGIEAILVNNVGGDFVQCRAINGVSTAIAFIKVFDCCVKLNMSFDRMLQRVPSSESKDSLRSSYLDGHNSPTELVQDSRSRADSKDVYAYVDEGHKGAIFFRVGAMVERNIDGMWFVARVEAVKESREEMTVRYADDQNIEENVPFGEVRLQLRDSLDRPVEFTATVKEPLAKPLKGLIDDDADARKAHRPTVVIHSCADSEEAIILNGAENRLAAGGGLRALRHLKKLKGDDDEECK